MNGDSVSFDIMVEACVKGGYKREELTKEDSYIRTISFELVEKSKNNNKIYLCLLVNENNEMLGAFLDYIGETSSFKSVDDIENMRIE